MQTTALAGASSNTGSEDSIAQQQLRAGLELSRSGKIVDAIAARKPQLESLLPEANIQDYRDANSNITRALAPVWRMMS